MNTNLSIKKELCETPCNVYKKILNSQVLYFYFISFVDIIPSVVKCHIFYKLLVKHKFIISSNINDYYLQYLEINKNLFTKFIVFKSVYVKNFYNFIKNVQKINYSIGIHYRMIDKCFKSVCRIDDEVTKRFNNEIKRLYTANSSIIFISTVNNVIANRIAKGYEYIQYMPDQKTFHISMINRSISINEINKLIGDILLVSSAKVLMLSAGSTFSLLILAIGGFDLNGRVKSFNLYDSKGRIVNKSKIDIIKTELEKHKCIKCVYYTNK